MDYFKKLMQTREFHKMKAVKCNSRVHWTKYNSEIRKSKKNFFCEKIKNCALAKDPNQFLNENLLLSKHQYGFRPKNLTQSALIEMYDARYESMANGDLIGAVFLDIRKALDSVNRNILLAK